MTLSETLEMLWLRLAPLATLLALVGLGCGDSGGEGAAGSGGAIFIDGGFEPRCEAPTAPETEPEMIEAPVFASEELPPGSSLEGEIEVDAETRTVQVELVNFWKLDEPPLQVTTLATRGDEILTVSLPTDSSTRGRYFFRITLCGEDCQERRVLFTIIEDPDEPNLRNDPYQRLVFEGDTEVGRSTTCHWPDSVAIQ